MALRFVAVVAAAALSAAPAYAGCSSAYSYTGFVGTQTTRGVSARITALAAPNLRWGHVAAWVGVGGPGAGPNGSDEWLQVGLSGYDIAAGNNLYVEYAAPGASPKYTEIESGVAIGVAHTVAVLEIPSRRGWWRAWVDDRPVSDPLHLPGSHAAWQPMVVAESWNGGRDVCNAFAYEFDAVRTVTTGRWSPFASATQLAAPGYRLVRRTATSWTIRGG